MAAFQPGDPTRATAAVSAPVANVHPVVTDRVLADAKPIAATGPAPTRVLMADADTATHVALLADVNPVAGAVPTV